MGKNVLILGVNDLQSQRPDIAKEFDVEKNGITPDKVFLHSNKEYYWICSTPGCGWKWPAYVNNRVRAKKSGCPVCKNKILVPGRNDLATKYPKIAEEWCYELNNCKPTDVFPHTRDEFVWICRKCKNNYSASPNSRCKENGTGCCYWSGRKPIYG